MPPPVAESLSLREVADRLGVHYMTAYRYVRNGRLPAHKVGDEWRVDPSDLAALRPGARRTPARRGAPDREESRRRIEARLLAGDEVGAWGVVEAATAAGAEPSEVLTSLVSPALEHIGAQWAAGQLSVADEHRATAVAHRLVARLGPSFVRPGRRRGTVVLGSVAGDRHALPTAMLGDLLRGERFDVVDLGPDTPAESFVATAASVDRLQAVGICVSDSGLIGTVPDLVRAVRAGLADTPVPVHVGGAAITDEHLARRVGSDGYASDPVDVVALFASPRVSVLD